MITGKKRIIVALTATLLCAAVVITLLFLSVGLNSNQTVVSQPNSYNSIDAFPAPPKTIDAIDSGKIALSTRTSNKYFYTMKNGQWTCTFLKGVNMGLTLPTTDLNNPDIPYSTYKSWLEHIASMNANTIKVFTIMNPDFYRAFADYNDAHTERPLYLLQGIWFNENYMTDIGDAFGKDEKIIKDFTRATREAIDIIHGNNNYTSYGTIENAIYDRDISPYVVGFILGLEWQPDFVIHTNNNHQKLAQFSGQYLQTQNAAPFEIFLAKVGNMLIDYETATYTMQHPVAFLNWSTTDTLKHTNEPFPEEDLVSVNTETIKATTNFYPGLFAAIDVYPYYPEFINHQPEYINFKDATGKSNPYRAYLRDVQNQYSVPVVIAEFGVPTSRGIAHRSVMSYHQGGINEKQQGEIIVSMAQDIAREQYAGAMIFSWQDEWFKQIWNTIKYAPTNTLQRGLNVECAEQRYGIAAYEPGTNQNISYPDGNISEWTNTSPVFVDNDLSLYAKTDEAYLYLMAKLPVDFSFKKNKLAIALSLTDHGNLSSSTYSLDFNRPTDFLLILDGKSNTRLLTDAYYDRFYYQYSVNKKIYPRNTAYEKQNSGLFNTIRTFTSNEILLPLTKETIPPEDYESGLLRFGNGNPTNSSYDSLADFFVKDDKVEFRIPWYLLNVMNAPEKTILNDFYTSEGISFTKGSAVYMGACRLTSTHQTISLCPYIWNTITKSTYHMRLKQSYSIIQNGFRDLMNKYS